MARVLLVYASKYGGTATIARRIGERLSTQGMEVEVLAANTKADISGFDTIIVGSALYMFRWRREAIGFVKRHRSTLLRKGVWVFSSGPTKAEDLEKMRQTWAAPRQLKQALQGIKAHDNVLFGGVSVLNTMRGFDRWIMKKISPADVDIRDWETIEAWADGIAAANAQMA
jgi:menaquinone-dependent protoporphyrinogen oxidase